MADDLAAILVAQTGKVYHAPLATTIPADASTAWAATWKDFGTIGEDGLTLSFAEDTTDVKRWDGATVRKLFTSFDLTFAFTCLESNAEVLNAYYRTTITAGALDIRGGIRDARAWGFDVIDAGTHLRYVVTNGELTERGDITHKADEPIAYAFTVTAYPDSNGTAAVLMSDATAFD